MSTSQAVAFSQQGVRRPLAPASVDFAAREAAISALEREYDESLNKLDELNARLEACLAQLTGKAAASSSVAQPAAEPPSQSAALLREAA
jgi:hypothetical protein